MAFLTTLMLPVRTQASYRQPWPRALLTGGLGAIAAIATSTSLSAIASELPTLPIAQTPIDLPPIPYASTGSNTFPSEQYVVFVNGNSDLLLAQIRQVAPDAFITRIDGSSVIQVGRFNSLQNAQLRADELALFGIGAQVQPTAFSSAPIAIASPTSYPASIPVNATASIAGDLPPLPVSATSPAVEFGQVSPFQTVPPPPTSAYPTDVAPPTANAVPIAQQANTSGYYIVVPGRDTELFDLANQVINLGAPRSLVQTRTTPRGPHVAVGPYNDFGIANEWSNYLRDAGLLNARVHFE
ncbi:MAG: hypothetical protein ACFBSF_02645 [Leptolyngbyaceae cyanobacterium]